MKDIFDNPYNNISDAIEEGDVEKIATLFEKFPEMVNFKVPTFGSWLHDAAAHGTLEIVTYLVERGFDVSADNGRNGRSVLDYAAGRSDHRIAQYLLDQGARLQNSVSQFDILFGAIVGQSPEIVRLLLDRGIDSTVRYSSDTMENMDATAFAMERGELELANMIALHNAGGDAEKAKALVTEADAIARENNRWAPGNKFSRPPDER